MDIVNKILNLLLRKWCSSGIIVNSVTSDLLSRVSVYGGRDRNGLDRALRGLVRNGLDRTCLVVVRSSVWCVMWCGVVGGGVVWCGVGGRDRYALCGVVIGVVCAGRDMLWVDVASV